MRLHYELIKRGQWGRLLTCAEFDTGITGYTAGIYDTPEQSCHLAEDGLLVIYAGFEWDFGSGPSIDTAGMVRASLAHDALCHLTNGRLVPWSVRAQADRYFRQLLAEHGKSGGLYTPINWTRRWYSWTTVALYSQLWARWADRQAWSP